jgi:hypothetical protein
MYLLQLIWTFEFWAGATLAALLCITAMLLYLVFAPGEWTPAESKPSVAASYGWTRGDSAVCIVAVIVIAVLLLNPTLRWPW